MYYRGFFLPPLLLGLTACAPFSPQSQVLEVDKKNTHAVTYPGNLRGAYFVDKNSQVKFCSEPVPDVAMENLQKLAASISAELPDGSKGDGSLNSEVKAKVIELAGRTELLLVAREMLYRACELSINHDIDPNNLTAIYKTVAELIRDLATADKKQAEAEFFESFNESKRLLEEEARKNTNQAFPQ